MLVDYEYIHNKLLLSYIDKSGKIKLKYLDWQNPYNFHITTDDDEDRHPKYMTWDKKAVKKKSCRVPNKYSIYDFIDSQSEELKEQLFGYTEPEIYFIDIETEVTDDGFPEPLEAKNKITAITITTSTRILTLGVKPLTDAQILSIQNRTNEYFKKYGTQYELKYVYFKEEYDMMHKFFHNIIPKMGVITGWNFVGFDWVYLVNRARKLNISPEVASITKKLERPYSKPEEAPKNEELPRHRIVIDMMELYAKWDTSVKIKENNQLDFVANAILGLPKIHYKGTLQELYNNDFEEYIYYNIVDTVLVKHIHEKQKYIDILYAIATLSNIRIADGLSAVRVTEGVFRNKYRDNLDIVYVNKFNSEIEISLDDEVGGSDELKGAWVKEPLPGMYQDVVCFDFNSLYPTTMREFNVAPESFKGVKISEDKCMYQGIVHDIEDNDIVLLNNAVFTNEESETKMILSNIYADRKKNKTLMKQKKAELKEIETLLSQL